MPEFELDYAGLGQIVITIPHVDPLYNNNNYNTGTVFDQVVFEYVDRMTISRRKIDRKIYIAGLNTVGPDRTLNAKSARLIQIMLYLYSL